MEVNLAKDQRTFASSHKEWEERQAVADREMKKRESEARAENEQTRRALSNLKAKEKQLAGEQTALRSKGEELRRSEIQARRRDSAPQTPMKTPAEKETALGRLEPRLDHRGHEA